MITTFECVAQEIVHERRGANRQGGEYHRLDIRFQTMDGGPKARPRYIVVCFYSSSGNVVRYPLIGQHIRLTVSVTSSLSTFNKQWYNNINALEFELIPE